MINETHAKTDGDFMRYAPFIAWCATVFLPAVAMADPMPVLPDLPPLPTHYQSQGATGFYAGILAGYVDGSGRGLGLGVVAGNTFSAADLLLGVEAIGLAASYGEVTIEGSLRAGASLTEIINLFAHAGLGYSFDTGAFISVGANLEADVGNGWLMRADYRYNHDLTGDLGSHRILTGLLRTF